MLLWVLRSADSCTCVVIVTRIVLAQLPCNAYATMPLPHARPAHAARIREARRTQPAKHAERTKHAAHTTHAEIAQHATRNTKFEFRVSRTSVPETRRFLPVKRLRLVAGWLAGKSPGRDGGGQAHSSSALLHALLYAY